MVATRRASLSSDNSCTQKNYFQVYAREFHRRFDDARHVIERIATINGVAVPDLSELEKVVLNDEETSRRIYTLLDLLKTRKIRKNTLLLSVIWQVLLYSFHIVYSWFHVHDPSCYIRNYLKLYFSYLQITRPNSSNNKISRINK